MLFIWKFNIIVKIFFINFIIVNFKVSMYNDFFVNIIFYFYLSGNYIFGVS